MAKGSWVHKECDGGRNLFCEKSAELSDNLPSGGLIWEMLYLNAWTLWKFKLI